MQLPEPQSRPYSALIADIEAGRLKIPQFQREFVWTREKSAHLLDSIIKGYPIGTFIIWRTRESLRSVRNIGNANLPEPPTGDYVNYVLDGQQRLTSLFATLKGLNVIRDGKAVDFSEMYIDLHANEHEKIVITNIDDREPSEYIKLRSLIDFDFAEIDRYPAELKKKMQAYRDRINSYNFSLVSISDAPIDIATEIFTRINEGGKPLTVFEIMVAKMFDAPLNFDLSVKYDTLVNERLKNAGYETTSPATLLQFMSVILTKTKECKRQHILNLDKDAFIKAWEPAISAFESAIEYCRDYFRIPVSRLLPYNALLVPLAYFFYHHKNKPSGEMQKNLTDFFWRVSLSGRYSSSVESKLAQDIKRIDSILEGNLPHYDFPVDCSAEFIKENGSFRTSSSYIKALLCLLAYQEPKSFIDDSKVRIDNAWLKQANSKNYHHFFPRAYLRKQGVSEDMANHIANITIVDDYLNKKVISAKAPSIYMAEFTKSNAHLRETMKTHLIDADSPALQNDNYEQFLEERCKWLSKELKARVIQQKIDEKSVVLPEDEEEVEEITA